MLALFSTIFRRWLPSRVRALKQWEWPNRKIGDDCFPELGPLMIRYFLLRTPWVGMYFHKFLRSDNDRHVHDHPWSFITLLLNRGYWEHLPDGTAKWRKRFTIHYRPAEWQHWVEIDKPVWTLVLRFRKRRQWGFITPAGWINHFVYGIDWCGDELQSANAEKSQPVLKPEESANI
jgi:hypothetical protein